MGLLDRLPGEGRRGVLVAAATGVAALLVASVLAWLTWGGDDASPSAGTVDSAGPSDPVRVVSRKGGFSVDAPAELTGAKVGPHVRLTTTDKSMVITVGPGPRGSRAAAQKRALSDIRRSYDKVKVERRIATTLGGGPAVRSVGVLRHESGTQLIFSVTSTARGKRTWSVVMFAERDIKPEQLARFYDPVLEGFAILG
jgi:hypothetical protein